LIVFDLKCARGHVFEAWFASSSAFEEQKRGGLLACAICDDGAIDKAPMAAHVGAKGNVSPASSFAPMAAPAEPSAAEVKALLGAMAKAQSKMLACSDWVGRDFDRKARAMDAGEIDKAAIHGEVTPAEAKALQEDGIAALPLPFPVIPPEKRN
jgi:hypothetical protein